MTLSLVPKNDDYNHNDLAIAELYKHRHQINIHEAIASLHLDSLTRNHREELARMFDLGIRDINQLVKNVDQNKDCLELLGKIPKNEYEFVDFILEKWNTDMTFQGIFHIETDYVYDGTVVSKRDFETLDEKQRLQVVFADPKRLTAKEILRELIYNNRMLKLNYNDRELGHALGRWIDRNKNLIKSIILSRLSYAGQVEQELAEVEWDRLVKAITGVNLDETKIVLKHFIWQVKRKMRDLPVRDHMMIVLFGAQGSGKSTLVKDYLCKPIADFVASTDFATITDERNHDIWLYLVLIFDEMGRSTSSHIDDIKRKITDYSFNGRNMGTNTSTIVRNCSTMIGTTNRDISRLLYDDTGMRRFFQIDCLRQMDWNTFSQIKFLALWRSVNENEDSPLKQDFTLYQSIQKIQNGKRQITLLEQWLRDRPYKIGREEIVNANDLFQEYVEFHKKNNNDRCDVNTQNFGRSITDTALNIPGLIITKRKVTRGNQYTLIYSEEINLDY